MCVQCYYILCQQGGNLNCCVNSCLVAGCLYPILTQVLNFTRTLKKFSELFLFFFPVSLRISMCLQVRELLQYTDSEVWLLSYLLNAGKASLKKIQEQACKFVRLVVRAYN